jgi:hypothetical protein
LAAPEQGISVVIGFDKILHFLFSFLIAQVSPALAYATGWAKEFYDLATGGVIDLGDLIADGLGILTAIVVFP